MGFKVYGEVSNWRVSFRDGCERRACRTESEPTTCNKNSESLFALKRKATLAIERIMKRIIIHCFYYSIKWTHLAPQLLQFLDEQIGDGPCDLQSASSLLRLRLFWISYSTYCRGITEGTAPYCTLWSLWNLTEACKMNYFIYKIEFSARELGVIN